jgi:hypothetical protein
MEASSFVTADGKHFFFNRQFDVCSARAGLVGKLRPERAGDTRFAEVEER